MSTTVDDVYAIFQKIILRFAIKNGNIQWIGPEQSEYNWFVLALDNDENFSGNYFLYSLNNKTIARNVLVDMPYTLSVDSPEDFTEQFKAYIFRVYEEHKPKFVIEAVE